MAALASAALLAQSVAGTCLVCEMRDESGIATFALRQPRLDASSYSVAPEAASAWKHKAELLGQSR